MPSFRSMPLIYLVEMVKGYFPQKCHTDSDSELRNAGLQTEISVQTTQKSVTKIAPPVGLGPTLL